MSAKDSVCRLVDTQAVVIAAGESVSGHLDCVGLRLFGIIMPAAWTAAALTVEASFDNGLTWHGVNDLDGNEYQALVTPVAGKYQPVNPSPFQAVSMLRIRSGTEAFPVNQLAARTIGLVLSSY
jgi:hypothetical protein